MVVAKTEKPITLVSQFSQRTTGKVYRTLVAGHPQPDKERFLSPLGVVRSA